MKNLNLKKLLLGCLVVLGMLGLASCSTCYESKELINSIENMNDVKYLQCEINRKWYNRRCRYEP